MEEIRKLYDIIKPYAKLILLGLAIVMFLFLSLGGMYEDEGNGWQFLFNGYGEGFPRFACALMLLATIGAGVFQVVKIQGSEFPLSMTCFLVAFAASFLFAVTMDSDEDMGVGSLMSLIISAVASFVSVVQYLCEKPVSRQLPRY